MIAAAFLDPVTAAQSTFSAVLNATARPGTIVRLTQPLSAPRPLSAAAGAIALTMCDPDTPVWLDADLRSSPAVVEWLRFHTGARIIDEPADAAFAFVSAPDELPPFDWFGAGTPDYPDRSTTVVLLVQSFQQGSRFVLTGPGIRHEQQVQVAALPDDMPERLAANRRLFPRGIDLVLVTETDVMALPRSVRLIGGER
jgi:alpha-D-ribose 1-methylphosphonate 5-triphosphate synthase subunit PhnH